MSSQSTAIRAT